MLSNRKKGFSALGFGVVVALAVLLLSAGPLYATIKYIASKFDETVQVESCRLANTLKYGV